MGLLVRGNDKLGNSIWTFGTPSRGSCPGRSEVCSPVCYSWRIEQRYSSVKKKYRDNLIASKQPDFSDRVIAEIDKHKIHTVRISVAGDLYTPQYAWKWHRVAKLRPATTFFLYTRSWRKPGFYPVLKALAARPNVHLWYSVDAATGAPPKVPKGVRLAYLQSDKTVTPKDSVDLVFRTTPLRKIPLAVVGTAPVCPTETGLPEAADATCETCTKCFTPSR